MDEGVGERARDGALISRVKPLMVIHCSFTFNLPSIITIDFTIFIIIIIHHRSSHYRFFRHRSHYHTIDFTIFIIHHSSSLFTSSLFSASFSRFFVCAMTHSMACDHFDDCRKYLSRFFAHRFSSPKMVSSPSLSLPYHDYHFIITNHPHYRINTLPSFFFVPCEVVVVVKEGDYSRQFLKLTRKLDVLGRFSVDRFASTFHVMRNGWKKKRSYEVVWW